MWMAISLTVIGVISFLGIGLACYQIQCPQKPENKVLNGSDKRGKLRKTRLMTELERYKARMMDGDIEPDANETVARLEVELCNIDGSDAEGNASAAAEAAAKADAEAEDAAREMEEAEQAFRDICKDGIMSMLAEAASGTRSPPRTPSKEEVEMKQLMTQRMFSQIDTDGSGLLDEGEMKVLFKNLGLELTQEQEDFIMKEIDEDGSGEIDFDEFFKWYSAI